MSTNGGLQASGRGSRSARGAGSDVPVDVDIRAMAFGYHDPDTGRWVPPVRGAARIRHGDVDTDSDEEDKEFDRRLSGVLARGTGAAASSRSVAKAAAAPARAAPVSPRSHVDLSDLLNDAEQQSTRVISRRKLGASDV
ncbi:hypothetical protein EON66_11590 [archaeon]|nr:MAG: hypothetical protein EON66_11590 [archaeon]